MKNSDQRARHEAIARYAAAAAGTDLDLDSDLEATGIERFMAPMLRWNLSGLGLRATDGRKPRQVRKEATVVVRFVCRGFPGAWHFAYR